MRPLEYFRDLVEPAVAEFENNPTDIRRAYIACGAIYHFADAAAVHLGRKPHEVTAELSRLAPAFSLVRDIANMSKHIVLDPKRKENQGRPLPKIDDTHVGPQAAFSDGTFWSDGTSWTDSKDVVRTRDDTGRHVDVSWCVREGRRAIETYLQRPDMQ